MAQLLFGAPLVFVGWNVLYLLLAPTSSNWGWVVELKTTFAVLVILIFLSNIFFWANKKLWHYALGLQLLLVFLYAVSRYTIYPNRAVFLLVANALFILSILPIRAWLRRASAVQK
jgi:hypothetical protein